MSPHNALTNLGGKLGRFFSNFNLILLSLLIYLALSGLTCVWLLLSLAPAYRRAAFLAYELSSGSDPINFTTELQNHFWLWKWVLFFHIISWLIVPVLVATAIDASYHLWEQRRRMLERKLSEQMVAIIVETLGMSVEEARELAANARMMMEGAVKGDRKQL